MSGRCSRMFDSVINAVHALFYSDDAPVTRAFFRDVLGWPFLEHEESGPGWLIFRSGPSEVGVHPNSWTVDGTTTAVPIHHELSFMCDDIDQTVAELRAKGAEVLGEPADLGFGVGVTIQVPAAGEVLLYQPSYPPSHGL
jgi:predicted enzyme related to lactoylglutathione lyase